MYLCCIRIVVTTDLDQCYTTATLNLRNLVGKIAMKSGEITNGTSSTVFNKATALPGHLIRVNSDWSRTQQKGKGWAKVLIGSFETFTNSRPTVQRTTADTAVPKAAVGRTLMQVGCENGGPRRVGKMVCNLYSHCRCCVHDLRTCPTRWTLRAFCSQGHG
jgi:hypothetical protein